MIKVIDSTGRIFYPHTLWEDANNGFYSVGLLCPEKVSFCKNVLSNQELFWDIMCQMRIDWPYSFQFNVSNFTQNRRAWLGQAACCYNHNAEFNVTIYAWGLLDKNTQDEANKTAQKMIDLFEREEMDYAKKVFRAKCFRRCQRTIEMDV